MEDLTSWQIGQESLLRYWGEDSIRECDLVTLRENAAKENENLSHLVQSTNGNGGIHDAFPGSLIPIVDQASIGGSFPPVSPKKDKQEVGSNSSQTENDVHKPYKIGDTFDILIDSGNDTGKTLSITVKDLLGTPWQNGCVMIVTVDGPNDFAGRHVLKIVDPRFLHLPGYHQLSSPRIRSQKYVDAVCTGQVETWLQTLKRDITPDPDCGYGVALRYRLQSVWQTEALLWEESRFYVERELLAYAHLISLQAHLTNFSSISGFLMELIDGLPLDKVSENIPRYFSQDIMRDVVAFGNVFDYFNISHNSLSPRNIIIRHTRSKTLPNIVFIDWQKHELHKPRDLLVGDNYHYHSTEDDLMTHGLRERLPHSKKPSIILSALDPPFTIWTGRHMGQEIFGVEYYGIDAEEKLEAAQHQWEIIMDDIWHLSSHEEANAWQYVDAKAALSRKAFEIMLRELINEDQCEWEWIPGKWHVRSLYRIADMLDFDQTQLENKFEAAFWDRYLHYREPVTPSWTFIRCLEAYEELWASNKTESSGTIFSANGKEWIWLPDGELICLRRERIFIKKPLTENII